MKYPFVVFFRYPQYSDVDVLFEENKDSMDCSIFIIEKKEELNKLFNSNYQIVVSYGHGEDEQKYIEECNSIIAPRMRKRWIHYSVLPTIAEFCRAVNYCFIHNCTLDRTTVRPTFSIFTTTYNSYDKILRAYASLQSQTFKDWEWVVLDDSPNDEHFQFLRTNMLTDHRIRLYKRGENSGNIGNVKNEAVSLCRGKYLIEFDHDDEIPEYVLQDSTTYFDAHPEVGFIYMDFINIYENGENFRYGEFFGKGYSHYYCQKYKGRWRYVYITANINNVSLSHLVCMPNHPRIWRRDVLLEAGNYCEFLPINDDQEILIRTALMTKIAKINKIGYVQYMNRNNNNFSLIRNSEINRIGPRFLQPIFYDELKVHDKMKIQDAYESDHYIHYPSKIWKRDDSMYEPKFANHSINVDYDKQYCIIGFDTLLENLEKIRELYKNPKNDFILLDNKGSNDEMFCKLDEYVLDRFKCYAFLDETKEEMKKYFLWLYKSCDDYEIIG